MAHPLRLSADNVSVSFADKRVLDGLSITLEPATLTVIVGPNGSGKSTLLRAMARLQKLDAGAVVLGDRPIHKQKSREIARALAVLPQGLAAPDAITVRDLVARGRMPHQTPLQQWTQEDAAVVDQVLDDTGLTPIAHQPVISLSGGQQQRVWIAMTLAQQTDILLLDEPTTYLDLRYQIDLLRFIRSLADDAGKTIAMVLHDVNLAARYADRIVALRDGRIFCDGSPDDVITPDAMKEIFDLDCTVITQPGRTNPVVIPA